MHYITNKTFMKNNYFLKQNNLVGRVPLFYNLADLN